MKIGFTESGDAGLDFGWRDNLAQVDGVVLITKAPHELRKLTPEELPANFVLHCTITGYAGTKLEPGVASLDETLCSYHRWIDRIGGARCVLRVDPIIPTEKGLRVAAEILKHAEGRARISFLDLYPHVIKRFKARGLPIPWEGFHAPLEIRKAALKRLTEGAERELEVCGEPGIDCTGCLSQLDLWALKLSVEWQGQKSQQRKACACLGAKKELLKGRHPCAHNCAYCYWKD